MNPPENTSLANAVTAYATILSGIVPLALCWLMSPQPRRWLFAYLCVFITGVPTVWMHGFGEQFPARVADIGTNLLLAWALQVAVLGDFFTRRTQTRVAMVSAVINLAYIVWLIAEGPQRKLAITFGQSGEFTWGELLLIANSVFVVALLYARRAQIPAPAHSLLHLVTLFFFIGLLFATQSNHRLDFTVVAYHAIWHIVSAYGFIVLWAFNHARFFGVAIKNGKG
jgi:hypothetical protein